MKPASVAKLALRMSSAGMLFYLAPLCLVGMAQTGLQFIAQGEEGAPDSILWLLIFGMRTIAISTIALGFWFKADALSALFLPKGVPTDLDDTYVEAQRIGLMYIGAFIFFESMRTLMQWMGTFYIYMALSAFEFLMAIILIVGLNDVIGIIRRILRTNWWHVLMRLRAKLHAR